MKLNSGHVSQCPISFALGFRVLGFRVLGVVSGIGPSGGRSLGSRRWGGTTGGGATFRSDHTSPIVPTVDAGEGGSTPVSASTAGTAGVETFTCPLGAVAAPGTRDAILALELSTSPTYPLNLTPA